MQEYDRFAARLLLLGLLLRRRVVFPPIDCGLRYMHKALQARHLRGMEIGCGADRQCVWLPYPHHIDPWCSGVDFLYDIEYRGLVARGEVEAQPDEVAEVAASALRPWLNASAPLRLSKSEMHTTATVLQLRGVAEKSTFGALRAARRSDHGKEAADQLSWLPLGGFRTEAWRAPLPRKVEAVLRAPVSADGLGLSEAQVKIVKTCLKSLATSRE